MASTILARGQDPAGHEVVLDEDGWEHVAAEHPEMRSHQADILTTVASPTRERADPRPGRVRYYREGLGPSRWMLVVVDGTATPRRVVTAFGLRRVR